MKRMFKCVHMTQTRLSSFLFNEKMEKDRRMKKRERQKEARNTQGKIKRKKEGIKQTIEDKKRLNKGQF